MPSYIFLVPIILWSCLMVGKLIEYLVSKDAADEILEERQKAEAQEKEPAKYNHDENGYGEYHDYGADEVVGNDLIKDKQSNSNGIEYSVRFNKASRFLKGLIPTSNPLLSSLEKSLKNKDIFVLPEGLVVRFMDVQREDGQWHIWVDIFNLSTVPQMFRIEEITLFWGETSTSVTPSAPLEEISGSSGYIFYGAFMAKERKSPDNIRITVAFSGDKKYILE